MRNKYSLKELLDQLPSLDNLSYLDVGTGPQATCARLYLKTLREKTAKKGDVLLLDRVDYCNDKAATDRLEDLIVGFTSYDKFGTFVLGDAKNMPFENSTFDLITARNLLNNLYDEEIIQVLDEAHRVLKPGGHLIGEIPINYFSFIVWPRNKRLETKRTEWNKADVANHKGFELLLFGTGWCKDDGCFTKSNYFLIKCNK